MSLPITIHNHLTLRFFSSARQVANCPLAC